MNLQQPPVHSHLEMFQLQRPCCCCGCSINVIVPKSNVKDEKGMTKSPYFGCFCFDQCGSCADEASLVMVWFCLMNLERRTNKCYLVCSYKAVKYVSVIDI